MICLIFVFFRKPQVKKREKKAKRKRDCINSSPSEHSDAEQLVSRQKKVDLKSESRPREIGCFEKHEAYKVTSIYFEGSKKLPNAAAEALCTVMWRPLPQLDMDQRQLTLIPDPSRVPYSEVRKKAPKLLIDFYCNHIRFQ